MTSAPTQVSARLGWHSLGAAFDCACGVRHSLPIEACYVGEDAAARLGYFARERCGARAMIVADENTLRAAGDAVHAALRDAGKRLDDYTFTEKALDATDAAADLVRDRARGVDFLVAIGSGTICDLAKYAGHQLKIPVLFYPTAASMNGYTSGIAALKVRGLKRTLPCAPALGIFAEPSVSATAPRRMVAAGIADFLSKCSSSTDWRAAHFLRGGYYCDRPREFFDGTTENVLCAAQRIGRGETEAYKTVLDALMLSGFSMVLAGSSAPASGGEHLISHYLDMKSALYGTPHDLHGAQVGVGTLHCLRLWERVLALDPADIDVERLVDSQPRQKEIADAIDVDWGAIAPEIHQQWKEKSIDPKQLRAELGKLKSEFATFREECSHDLLPSEIVEKAIRGAVGPLTPEELHAPTEEYAKALKYARYIRNRFTILDLAAELGLS